MVRQCIAPYRITARWRRLSASESAAAAAFCWRCSSDPAVETRCLTECRDVEIEAASPYATTMKIEDQFH